MNQTVEGFILIIKKTINNTFQIWNIYILLIINDTLAVI